jgi:hypothetical protein
MSSKLVLRSFKNITSLNRIITTGLSHVKPNYTPTLNLKKNFSVTAYSAQQSSNNCKLYFYFFV